ncbi:hypothetical protein HPB49_008113 [Dermacentor silvarum]|uniref:Uncharacterized protein n=1 Tax=Dermacentor silvarum TaxID=543639 RepID=A0ACB8DBM8_DERSI|nr:hypothetical protein HPB49_008113 [Dermacentor silvarum]
MSILLEKLVSNAGDWRWITTVLVFALSYLLGRFYHRVSKYPRGPFPLPLVGNLLALRNVKDLHFKATELTKTYGDVFTLWMAHKPMVILNGHAAIREATLSHSPATGELQTQGNHDILFEDYNPRWKALRKVALLAVRKYAVSDSLEKLCADVVDAYVDSLPDGPQIIDSRTPFFYLLYNVIGVSVYGTKLDGEDKEIRRLEAIDSEFVEVAPNGLPSDIAPWLAFLYRGREKKIEDLFREFRDIVNNLFTKAEASYVPGKTENFTHAMLAAREEAIREEKGDAEYLTKGNMVQVVLTSSASHVTALMKACARRRPGVSPLYRYMARPKRTLTPEEEAARREKRLQATGEMNQRLRVGSDYLANKAADMRRRRTDPEYRERENQAKPATDTSAGELQWLFLMLAKEPSIQEKIQQEIQDNIGSTPPVYKDRAKLPYTVACLLEALRFRPIAPLGLPHKASTETKVGTLVIPKDTGILYNVYGVNHDPGLWENPEEFRPERFLDSATGKLRQEVGPLITFGMGPRTCPGEKLAHMDMFYILVRLMQRLSCSAPGKPSDVNLSGNDSSIFLLPEKQNIVLTKRN